MKNDTWWIRAAFFICAVVWFFAYWLTHTVLVFDALGYEELARQLMDKGVLSHFKALNREIFFPLRVSWAMHLENLFDVSYIYFHKLLGLCGLLVIQCIAVYFLRKLRVHGFFIFLAILVLGISPSSIKMAFDMFSEGFAALILTLTFFAFYKLSVRVYAEEKDNHRSVVFWSGITSATLIILTLTKALFEPVVLLLFIIFVLMAARRFIVKHQKALVFLLAGAVLFSSYFLSIHGYKSLHQTYAGQYAITDRSEWMFYGVASRRTGALTAQQWEVGIWSALLGHVYKCPYSYEECDYWSFWYSDSVGEERYEALLKEGVSKSDMKARMYSEAFGEIASKPLQFTGVFLFHFLPKLGGSWCEVQFVAYPDWMDGWYYKMNVLNWPRLVLRAITFLAFLWALFFVCRRQKEVSMDVKQQKQLLMLVIVMTLLHHFLASFGPSLERYLLPFYPMNVVLVMFMFSKVLSFGKNKK